MSTISVAKGSEGPSHDPYSFCELTVSRTSSGFTGTITLHQGLAEWLVVKEAHRPAKKFKDDMKVWFELYAGVSFSAAERAYRRYRERKITRHPCGVREIEEVDGMPGETLIICGKCGTVLDGTFDLEAVR